MSKTSGPKSETCDIACRTCSDYPYPSDMQGMVKTGVGDPQINPSKQTLRLSLSYHEAIIYHHSSIYIYVCVQFLCSSYYIIFLCYCTLSFLKDLMFVTFSPCPLPWVQAWGWIVGCYRHDPSKPRHSSPVSGNCHGETAGRVQKG